MDMDKIRQVLSDAGMVETLAALQTAEAVQAALKASNVELTLQESEKVMGEIAAAKQGGDELSADDLDSVAGGIVRKPNPPIPRK